MLIEKQIENLLPLKNHPKYGKILEKAIKTWENCNPIQMFYGTWFELDQNSWIDGNCGKCLIGAAIVNSRNSIKKPIYDCSGLQFDPQIIKASEEFNISAEEIDSIIVGFDGDEFNSRWHEESYNFGRYVAVALGLIHVPS